VLIADDEPHIELSLQFLLQRAGYKTVAVADGDAALACVRELRPDVVLLDIMMPGRNGYEVCEAVRADAGLRGTPIILLSARGQEVEVLKGLELGASAYVTSRSAMPSCWRPSVRSWTLERKLVFGALALLVGMFLLGLSLSGVFAPSPLLLASGLVCWLAYVMVLTRQGCRALRSGSTRSSLGPSSWLRSTPNTAWRHWLAMSCGRSVSRSTA
jgi:CheY-like chemotaxis protein